MPRTLLISEYWLEYLNTKGVKTSMCCSMIILPGHPPPPGDKPGQYAQKIGLESIFHGMIGYSVLTHYVPVDRVVA